jgi:hypothetical protein
MDAQGHLREAIVAELERQAANAPRDLQVEKGEGGHVTVHGRIDLEELSMAVAGALSGGP